MKILSALLLSFVALCTAHAAGPDSMPQAEAFPGERLGKASFAVSCKAPVRAPFSRGVALLHDFWYEEARRQFEEIAKSDPACAMAHWRTGESR
jgi:hypothetical protein